MLTLSQIAYAVDGVLSGEDAKFSSVSIDSRTLQPGALFVAIDGERFCGTDFVRDAKQAGAVAVMASSATDHNMPSIVVKDTQLALWKLAELWRSRVSLPVIGVTGSNGKTTVKKMIASILGKMGRTHASPGNFNNHLGVPLTLLGIRPEHEFAVVEMGMSHPGEIGQLARLVRPSVALITNAAHAHLEGVGSLSEVVRAKAEIFLGLQSGGTAVINADDRFAAYWAARTRSFQTITFGLDSQARVTGSASTINGQQVVEVDLPDESFEAPLNLLGRHNALNALAASSVGWGCGGDAAQIRAGLVEVQAEPGRLQIREAAHGATLIDDSYNANPDSLRAAIRTLSGRQGLKVLIIGNMAELGSRAAELHSEVGREARHAGIDVLIALGEMAGLAADVFGDNAKKFDSFESLISDTHRMLRPGVTVLVKGSRSAQMEQVANALAGSSRSEAIAC